MSGQFTVEKEGSIKKKKKKKEIQLALLRFSKDLGEM